MAKLPRPEQLELSNGIPVIFQPSDQAVAATYWWVKVGSGEEGKGEEGFAHFLEHMLFKDAAAKETGQASSGQTAREIESLGGDINAYTSFDQTVYHVTCAAHHWEKVLGTFGAMAKTQKFLKQDFEREREVILEELRKNEDAPSRQLFQALFTQTYRKHPYGRPVIGFARTLKAAKVGQLEAFYKRNYVPENMGIVMVGPFDEKRKAGLLKVLEQRFGQKALPKRKAGKSERPLETELRAAAALEMKRFDVKTPTLALSFRVPGLGHADLPALDILAGVLGSGELGRLYQRLFYRDSLVTEVSGGMYVPRDPGMLYFQAEISKREEIIPAARALFEELKRLRDEGPTEEELERVRVGVESERLYSTQTADGIAGRLGFLQYVMGDLSYDQRYLDEIRDVDARQVREVAARYLQPGRLSVVLLYPQDWEELPMKEFSALAQEFLPAEKSAEPAPAARKGRSAQAKRPSAEQPEVFTLPKSGLRVIYRERPLSHVMSLHAVSLGGLRLEQAEPVLQADKDLGASHLMALTWTKGTSRLDSRAIARGVEGAAAGMDGYSGKNTVGLAMTGLARDWDKLSDLFSEVMLDPVFPESEVEHSRRVVDDTLRSLDENSGKLCSKLFLETLFEHHPYGKLQIGTHESLASLDSQRLRAFHRRWIRPRQVVLSVVGNVRRSKMDSWLEQLEQRWMEQMAGLGPSSVGHTALADEPELKAPRWVERQMGREQTHLLVGGLGLRNLDRERSALQILTTILGGQSGRLFIELREKRSMAYSVSPVHFEGIERGYVGTYIACAPQKRQEAVQGIHAVLEKLAEKGPTASEMKRAREYYLGQVAMELQSDSSLSSHYGLQAVYGLPIEDSQALLQRMNSVTPEQVREVCARYWVGQPMVTCSVG